MSDLASKADLPGLLSFPKGAQKQLLKCHPNVSTTLAHNRVQRSETGLLRATAFTMTPHTHAAAAVGLSYRPLNCSGKQGAPQGDAHGRAKAVFIECGKGE